MRDRNNQHSKMMANVDNNIQKPSKIHCIRFCPTSKKLDEKSLLDTQLLFRIHNYIIIQLKTITLWLTKRLPLIKTPQRLVLN